MKPSRTKIYPTWGDIVAIIGIYIAASFCFGWIVQLLGRFVVLPQGCVQMIVYVLTFVATISYALWIRWLRTGCRGDREVLFTGWKLDLTWIFFGMIALFAATILIEPVLALFPDRWLELLDEHMRLGGWMMLTVIVAAPILEEILFRGIIQGSLVRKYGPWRGVLFASVVFGVVHGIPQQVVNAFFVGMVLGFVYYCSRSLVVAMVIHAINNAVSYFSWIVGGEQMNFTWEMIDDRRIYLILYAVALIVLALFYVAVIRRIRRDRVEQSIGKVTDVSSTEGIVDRNEENQDTPEEMHNIKC